MSLAPASRFQTRLMRLKATIHTGIFLEVIIAQITPAVVVLPLVIERLTLLEAALILPLRTLAVVIIGSIQPIELQPLPHKRSLKAG